MCIIKDQEGVSVMPSNVNKSGKLSTSQCQKGKSTLPVENRSVVTVVFLSYFILFTEQTRHFSYIQPSQQVGCYIEFLYLYRYEAPKNTDTFSPFALIV